MGKPTLNETQAKLRVLEMYTNALLAELDHNSGEARELMASRDALMRAIEIADEKAAMDAGADAMMKHMGVKKH